MPELKTIQVPALRAYWPEQGGLYMGLMPGQDGGPDYHLILSTVKAPKRMNWVDAMAWPQTVEADGHKDFTAPTRFESALMYAVARDEFEAGWHWTSTQYSDVYAYFQYFNYGQGYNDKSYEAKVRAVRRLIA